MQAVSSLVTAEKFLTLWACSQFRRSPYNAKAGLVTMYDGLTQRPLLVLRQTSNTVFAISDAFFSTESFFLHYSNDSTLTFIHKTLLIWCADLTGPPKPSLYTVVTLMHPCISCGFLMLQIGAALFWPQDRCKQYTLRRLFLASPHLNVKIHFDLWPIS